jgi:glycosyltransferase involved in cell wall biosynthesis
MRVFVHLAHDKDPDAWRAAWAAGTLVGRNDETPYGYGRASSMGCAVQFSRSCPTSAVAKATRLAARFALGFDLVHAIRQYDRILASDIVWTHTESQFLAVSSLLRQRFTGPKLIGQAVWLFDRWPQLTLAHKALFRRLIERVDVLTTLSPLNAEAAQRLFPGTRVEVVRFGIPFENPVAPLERSNRPVRVVAVGNDRHRDWSTLVKALSRMEGVELEILSGTAPRSVLHGTSNVSLRRARTNLELSNAYARSTVAVVPLLQNLHASGITAIQEAVLAGVPVIATDVGGLRSYFGDNEIIYVPLGDTAALRDAVTFTVLRGEESRDMVKRAQARIVNGGVNVQAYIERHVELSEELLGRAPRATVS